MRLIYKQSIAAALSASLLLGSVPAYAEEKPEMEKLETVYVNLTADGSERQMINSSWIKNSQFYPQVEDSTILQDILSVSGATLESNKDDKQLWKTNGDDVYYQAKFNKTLPIDVDIEYKLDGKKLSPKELAGQSGRLEMNIRLRNREYTGKLATPFTAVGVIPLKTSVFSNVEMENGKFYSDGNTQMAIFVAFPSMNDMLNLKSESFQSLKTLDFPDTFVLSADVKDFELETIGIAVTPQLPDMIADMDEDEDIDQDLADIREIKDAKNKFESADPGERLKTLLRSEEKKSRSQQLVDDLFRFYDLDTAIIEEMPAYVTKENIALFDRVKADFKKYKVLDLLDNQVLRSLPTRFNAMNIARAEMLLDWHDVFEEFDESRLDEFDQVLEDRKVIMDFLEDVEDLANNVRANKDKLVKLEQMAEYGEDLKHLLANSTMKNFASDLSEEDIAVMVDALTKKKVEEALAQYAGVLPEPGPLSPEEQMKMAALIEKFAAEGAVDPQSAAQIQTVIASGQMPPQLYEQLSTMLEQKIRAEVETQVRAKFNQGEELYRQISALEDKFSKTFGEDYLEEMDYLSSYFRGLKKDLDVLNDEEDKIHNKLERAKNLFKNEEDIAYFREWRRKINSARQDLDVNEENIQIMRDLLAEYDKPELKELYDHFDVILKDLDEIRPIVEEFNDTMEKPANDRAFHNMPYTLGELIRLRRSIFNNRDLADDLKLATSDDVIDAAKTLIDIIDKKDNDNKLDKLEEQLESAKSILEKKDSLIDLSQQYDSFAGKSSNVKSSVQFIMKTDEIKKPKVENDEIKIDDKKAPSFLEWLGSLFSGK